MISLENRLVHHPTLDLGVTPVVNSREFACWVRDITMCDESKYVLLQNLLYPGGDLDVKEAIYFTNQAGINLSERVIENYFTEASK